MRVEPAGAEEYRLKLMSADEGSVKDKQLGQQYAKAFRLRQTFSLVDADVSEYEIVVSDLQAKEHKHKVSE